MSKLYFSLSKKKFMMITIINLMMFIIPVLLAVALLTLLERKTLGYMQLRKGPKMVGPLGILQPFADGLKLFVKEKFKPSKSTSLLFLISPPLFFFMALLLWISSPMSKSSLKMTLSLLFIITFSSLSVYAILSAGWSSKSKYALLGAMRAVAQTMSYEVSFGLMMLPLIIMTGSWGLYSFSHLQQKKIWIMMPCLPLFTMWYMSALAETKRTPFDLAEGESELVSGYKVEYAGAPFALFFMGEYAKIMFMKLITTMMFLGSFTPLKMINIFNMLIIMLKTMILMFSFLWMRASFPRIRYDQLMKLMWKKLLPLTMSLLLFYQIMMALLKATPPHH